MTFFRTRLKREKKSLCNICRQARALTWDHITPKGAINLTAVEIETVFNRLVNNEENRIFTISQNGVKFRTICGNCNNSWLGKKYDPILVDFSMTVGKLLKTEIKLPKLLHVKTNPTALIRSLLGHLLAAKSHIDEVVVDEVVRKFFFDEKAPISEEIKVFYWVYPYTSIVILRDVVMPALRGRFDKMGFFNIVKYFPIAYLITDLNNYEGLMELTKFRNLTTTETADIPIMLSDIKPANWPELVDPGNIVMGGLSFQSSVHANPKKHKTS